MMAGLWSSDGTRQSGTSSSQLLISGRKKVSRNNRKRIRSNEDQPVVVAMFGNSEIRTYSHSAINEIGGRSTSEPTDDGDDLQMGSHLPQNSSEHPPGNFSVAQCEQQAVSKQNRRNGHQVSIPADLLSLVSHWELTS